MRRRTLIFALGASATLASRFAAAQPAASPVIGILRTPRREADRIFPPVFERAMRSLGWQDGANIRLEYRWADGRNETLPGLARELVSRNVDLLMAFGNTGVAAAQTASTTIPIVGMTDDMVAAGLAASMAHPGGNTTGVSILGTELDSKRLEILHELVPQARRLGILFDRTSAPLKRGAAELERTASSLGITLSTAEATSGDEVGPALDTLAAAAVEGVNVLASPILNAARTLIIERLRQRRLPAIYEWPETAEEGGLLAYGARLTHCYRQVAVLVHKILQGAKPAELPIEQPTVIALVINAKTAAELGLTIPPALLLRADAVIE